jgi:hypothetical protein
MPNRQSSAMLLPFKGSGETKKFRQEMRKHLRLIQQEVLINRSGVFPQEFPINSALIVCPRMRLKRKSFQRWFILHNVLTDFSLACQNCRRCDVGAVRMQLSVGVT